MIKGVIINGISNTTNSSTYQPSMKKHIMFANNSCQPMIGANDCKNYFRNSLPTIDLSEKRWFFALLVCVAVIAVFNLAITFWVINVLKLSDTGIGFGSFALTSKGIDIHTDITFDGTLTAKSIQASDPKESLTLNCGENANIVLKNNEFSDNSLTLDNEKLEIQANSFQIRSTNPSNIDNIDEILFDVQPDQITTYTQNLLSPTLGGHKIMTALETDSIRGTLYHDLRLDSRTKGVNIDANKDIYLESRGGDIMSQSYDNTVLTAGEAIVLNSRRLELRHLPKNHDSNDGSNSDSSYQLCVCESGKLFAVRADGVCKSDDEWCLSETSGQGFKK